MYPTYRRDERTDRERYLEDELERERDERRQEEDRQERIREERRREREEMRRYEERQADNWPEAFYKQARLCWREHNAFPEQNDDDPYFKYTAEANEKAADLWVTISKSKEMELEELRKKIDAVQDSIRLEVADALEKASDRHEYAMTADAIRQDMLDVYLDW